MAHLWGAYPHYRILWGCGPPHQGSHNWVTSSLQVPVSRSWADQENRVNCMYGCWCTLQPAESTTTNSGLRKEYPASFIKCKSRNLNTISHLLQMLNTELIRLLHAGVPQQLHMYPHPHILTVAVHPIPFNLPARNIPRHCLCSCVFRSLKTEYCPQKRTWQNWTSRALNDRMNYPSLKAAGVLIVFGESVIYFFLLKKAAIGRDSPGRHPQKLSARDAADNCKKKDYFPHIKKAKNKLYF